MPSNAPFHGDNVITFMKKPDAIILHQSSYFNYPGKMGRQLKSDLKQMKALSEKKAEGGRPQGRAGESKSGRPEEGRHGEGRSKARGAGVIGKALGRPDEGWACTWLDYGTSKVDFIF